ncbi:hypothetical protein [Nonomuraea ceibae]|uniref:hypothetical protein n=1 Tax=Nonomuraea ceibae TaxID=1935170 RepID=UPI001C602119|nr:hypothetical protein [Nonomuraea ceibae]
MTAPSSTPTPPERAGRGYALVAGFAWSLGLWQAISAGGWLAVWMFAAAFLAARTSCALQTIARQRVRLADPRRTTDVRQPPGGPLHG